MIRKMIVTGCMAAVVLGTADQAMAHFGMVIPSENIVTQQKKSVELQLSFSHPFEGHGMDLVTPEKFYVIKDGKETNLLDSLTKSMVMDHKAWQTSYQVKRPGVYHFAMEPKPYWEPSEDVAIIHYTKTIVAAFGGDEGWDEPIGYPPRSFLFSDPLGIMQVIPSLGRC